MTANETPPPLVSTEVPKASPAAPSALVILASGVDVAAHASGVVGFLKMYAAPLPPSAPGAPTMRREAFSPIETDAPNRSPSATSAGALILTWVDVLSHVVPGVRMYTAPLSFSSPGAPTAACWASPAKATA